MDGVDERAQGSRRRTIGKDRPWRFAIAPVGPAQAEPEDQEAGEGGEGAQKEQGAVGAQAELEEWDGVGAVLAQSAAHPVEDPAGTGESEIHRDIGSL
jgi:hypothetical protein